MNKLKVMVLMGGKNPEHEVSLISGREVVKHLEVKKYDVLPVVISKDGQKWQLKNLTEFLSSAESEIIDAVDLTPTNEVIKPEELSFRADVVFIAIHGPFGEDGTIQGLLELVGVPYTGSGVLASALGMDKAMFKKIMKAEGILTPNFFVLTDNDKRDGIWEKLELPLIVKPASQGSSVGVTIVRGKDKLDVSLNEAFKYGSKIIVEEYISGTEVTCGVLGNEKPIALPVVEIIPNNEFFNYKAKYVDRESKEIIPAKISEELTKLVQETAVKVYQSIGCRGFGRVDMIIFKGQPYILEINTIPGLTPNSLLPKEAAAAGISYPELLDKLIDLALNK